MTFKDYYKFPLKPMVGCERLKVLTVDNQMAFDWCIDLNIKDILKYIEIINNTTDNYKTHCIYIYNNQDSIVYARLIEHNKPLLRIRGWGHLTGIGGLHLSEEEAKAIQDEFGEYIVKMLNS